MIPRQIIEQIQSACDVVEVISSYIPLKKAGRNYKACCPFHGEKTPSFLVSAEKGIWHCFGCGAGGSVFNFLMQYERISFPEAVRLAAKRVGIEVPENKGPAERDGERKEDLYRLNEFAAGWYAQRLQSPAGKKAAAYLKGRGLDEAFIREFSIGYAPDSWDGLIKAAKGKGHRMETLLALGLVIRKEGSGRTYDRFRDRLMIPICDVSGRVVAFSGRVLGDRTPKYMNSPESVLFNKSRSLYGLNRAKRSIAERGTAVVVEGYFDYFALWRAGMTNVVASQGTAFTSDHARIIRRYTGEGRNEVIMGFDADAAGESAAVRSVDAFLEEGLRVRVLLLPGGHDPDTFIRRQGAGPFRELVDGAPEYFDFLLDRLCRRHSIKSEVGKARVASEFLDALARVKDEILREAYRKKLSERIDIAQEYVIKEIGKKTGSGGRAAAGEAVAARPSRLPPGEKEIMRLMLEDEKVMRHAALELTPEDFKDSQLKTIVRHAFELLERDGWAGSARLMACLADDGCAAVLSMLATEEQPCPDRMQVARDCIKYLKKRNLREEVGRIAKEISRRERAGANAAEIVELQQSLMAKKAELLKVS